MGSDLNVCIADGFAELHGPVIFRSAAYDEKISHCL